MDSPRPLEAPRRALVTGVAGFIASHVSDALLRQGTQVIGLDRYPPDLGAAAVNLRTSLRHPGFSYLHADLLCHDLAPAVEGADVVFHLAGLPGVRPSWGVAFPDYLACNVLATQRLMAECDRQHVPRLVLASSSSVYGEVGDGLCREDAPAQPVSPYGITKLAAEQLCLAYAQRPNASTSVTALRYFTVYGPRQRTDMLISRALRAALNGAPIHIFGDGTNRRDFTYIDDVVSATLAAATAPARAEVINVGGGSSTSITRLLATVERVAAARVPTIAAPPQPGDMSTTLADPHKARRLLAWRPRVDLTTGVTRHLEWMEQHTLTTLAEPPR
ncbi:NAD(P)-dependent oxidoreductase [Streptomyces sp. XD-27]|uniref:NAD-dependent epimerase/dehydratase family protein n=1 Tax=Streptomyces sp. XD-27 TaxID=3062779 RepID=UPI0026F45A12|nr:NAD-dependent epimerase/dehydratase family protein [Streptomyces sp. XD-27]WKX69366.1 NAD-dependent epimerase/dehydratase family protein [Streptomyces sp. XD-27]